MEKSAQYRAKQDAIVCTRCEVPHTEPACKADAGELTAQGRAGLARLCSAAALWGAPSLACVCLLYVVRCSVRCPASSSSRWYAEKTPGDLEITLLPGAIIDHCY